MYLRFAPVLFIGLTQCTSIYYQPARGLYYEPRWAGYIYRQVIFHSDDGKLLYGWIFKARNSQNQPTPAVASRGVVIQFHGNAENMSSHYLSLSWLVDHGYDFFTFDYRGYGGSEGSPDQEGLNRDALAAIRTVMESHPAPKDGSKNIYLYGQSLGGAVLMRALHDLHGNNERERICSVVVESTFSNYKRQARRVLAGSWLTWIFQPLGGLLVSNDFAPEPFISEISPIPLLVIQGTDDSVTPLANGREIFEAAREPKKFLEIQGGTHIDSMARDSGKNRKALLEYWEGLGCSGRRL